MTGLDHDSKRNPKLRAAVAAAPAGDGAALGRGFVKAVVEAVRLNVGLVGHAVRRATVQEFTDAIEPGAFVAVVQDAAGRPGLFVLAETAFLSLIEALTMGALLPRAPASRLPTATDAALLHTVIDRTLVEAGARCAAFVYDRPILNLRLIELVLEEPRYDLLEVAVTLGDRATRRDASLLLVLPPPASAPAPDADPEISDPAWSRALDGVVMEAPADLRAELGRLHLTLAQIASLAPGATLNFPLSNLEDVRLNGADGHEVARARLGQWRGMRALRVMSVHDGTARGGGLPISAPFTEASGSALRSDPA